MLDFAFVRRSGSGKTNVWNVTVTRVRIVGTIAWFPKWGRYVFTPTINECLSAEHLDKIAAFMRSDAAMAPAVGSATRPARAATEPIESAVGIREAGPSYGAWVRSKKSRRLKRRKLGAASTVGEP